jgi:hypothetical protein
LGFGSLSVLEWMTDDISEKIPQQPSTTSADLCLEVNPDTEHTFFGAGNTSASPQAVFGNDISIKIMGYQKRLVPGLPNGIGRERCCAPLAGFTIVTDITSKMMSLCDFKVGVINAMKYLCGGISW